MRKTLVGQCVAQYRTRVGQYRTAQKGGTTSSPRTALRKPSSDITYARPGSEIGYAATRCAVLKYGIMLRVEYGMPQRGMGQPRTLPYNAHQHSPTKFPVLPYAISGTVLQSGASVRSYNASLRPYGISPTVLRDLAVPARSFRAPSHHPGFRRPPCHAGARAI
eukprot:1229376-Rhodomonas_salina.3